LAAGLAYGGVQPDVAEPLTQADLFDTRLDAVFCSCDAPGCRSSWISAGQVVPGAAQMQMQVLNPRGGRCEQCGGYYCRNHFAQQALPLVQCPRCGGALDAAPQVSNGRPARQTARRNQPLVHVQVLREGSGRISPSYLETLFGAMAPEVLEESPTISAMPVRHWPDDCQGLALAILANRHDKYLTDTYNLYVYDGRDQGGVRWALVKVYTKQPKYVDPDVQPDTTL
jgi:hypothetical protein